MIFPAVTLHHTVTFVSSRGVQAFDELKAEFLDKCQLTTKLLRFDLILRHLVQCDLVTIFYFKEIRFKFLAFYKVLQRILEN